MSEKSLSTCKKCKWTYSCNVFEVESDSRSPIHTPCGGVTPATYSQPRPARQYHQPLVLWTLGCLDACMCSENGAQRLLARPVYRLNRSRCVWGGYKHAATNAKYSSQKATICMEGVNEILNSTCHSWSRITVQLAVNYLKLYSCAHFPILYWYHIRLLFCCDNQRRSVNSLFYSLAWPDRGRRRKVTLLWRSVSSHWIWISALQTCYTYWGFGVVFLSASRHMLG